MAAMTSRQRTAAIRKIVNSICDTFDFTNEKRSNGTRRLKFCYQPHLLAYSKDSVCSLICAGLAGAGITYNSVRWRTGVTQLRHYGNVDYEYIEIVVHEISG